MMIRFLDYTVSNYFILYVDCPRVLEYNSWGFGVMSPWGLTKQKIVTLVVGNSWNTALETIIISGFDLRTKLCHMKYNLSGITACISIL